MTRFSVELRKLYEAAGSPTLATLVHQGKRQKPPVVLKDATLSNWLNGQTVPSNKDAVAFLVGFLEGRAPSSHPRQGVAYWEQLRKQDVQARRGQPARRPQRIPARAAAPAYLQQVSQMAPEKLSAREPELADLTAFCTRQGGVAYSWWRAPAWSGKSALLSWFVLHPSPGVRLVSFFVTARLGGQADRTAFLDVVLDQLARLLGESVPSYLSVSNREAYFLDLLARACPLVLVVDGLDEDLGWTADHDAHSIAALLPAVVPPGLRVIVASRADPPLPTDVPLNHPLRNPEVRRDLSPSPYAEVVRHDAHRDLRRLMGGTPLQKDLLGLVTASGGGLSATDLAELTGRGHLEIADELGSVAGRAFQSRVGPVYFLAHEDLKESALGYLGPRRLEEFRIRLHAWADEYAVRGWPLSTPAYLLRPYSALVQSLGDVPRMVRLATDLSRQDRLLTVTGGDTAGLADIMAVAPPDLSTAARLAVHREWLRSRNANLPDELVEVRARLGQCARAEALARAMGDSGARALRLIVAVAAESGDVNDALRIAEEITSRAEQVRALLAIAAVGSPSDSELLARALTVSTLIEDAALRARALGEVAVVAAKLGVAATYAAAADSAERVSASLPTPGQREVALSDLIDHVIRAGDIARLRN